MVSRLGGGVPCTLYKKQSPTHQSNTPIGGYPEDLPKLLFFARGETNKMLEACNSAKKHTVSPKRNPSFSQTITHVKILVHVRTSKGEKANARDPEGKLTPLKMLKSILILV